VKTKVHFFNTSWLVAVNIQHQHGMMTLHAKKGQSNIVLDHAHQHHFTTRRMFLCLSHGIDIGTSGTQNKTGSGMAFCTRQPVP